MQIQGKLVVISGASSGIGAATARAFAARGARVALVARSQAALTEIAQSIQSAGGSASVYAADLSDMAATAQTCAAICRQEGAPDIVVNNAGSGRWLSIEETEPSEAAAMMALPYLAAFALSRGFIAAMIERGSGQIINVTSPAAYTPFPGAVAYSVARASMRAFTNALHSDLRGTGVRASLVVCGEVESGYWAHNPGARDRLPRIARILPVLTNEQAAAAILRVAETGQRRIIAPALLRALIWLWFAMPWLPQALIDVTGHRRGAR